MNERLVQLLRERQKAIAAGLSSVILAGVYAVAGINLDPAVALLIAGAVVSAVVHAVPNVKAVPVVPAVPPVAPPAV